MLIRVKLLKIAGTAKCCSKRQSCSKVPSTNRTSLMYAIQRLPWLINSTCFRLNAKGIDQFEITSVPPWTFPNFFFSQKRLAAETSPFTDWLTARHHFCCDLSRCEHVESPFMLCVLLFGSKTYRQITNCRPPAANRSYNMINTAPTREKMASIYIFANYVQVIVYGCHHA